MRNLKRECLFCFNKLTTQKSNYCDAVCMENDTPVHIKLAINQEIRLGIRDPYDAFMEVW